MKNIVIIGATSAIAEAVGKEYAKQGHNFLLFARSAEKLADISADYQVRGASEIRCETFDAKNPEDSEKVVSTMFSHFEHVDIALIAHGSLPDQTACESSLSQTLDEITINGLSAVSLMTLIAPKMEQQGKGNLTVISSVAGDRGRQSNYVYGAAKSLVSTFAEGLSQRLQKAGVHVLDIKPGFVDTPMTAEFKKGALWTKPETVAALIIKRIDKQSLFPYAPSFWALIMLIIKTIPRRLFNKLKL